MQKKIEKIYKVNHFLYSLIIIAILVITIVATIIFATNDGEHKMTYISSIVIGLLSGGLSSVIISYVVELGNCKRKNDLITHEFNNDIETLKFWITELLQSMADSISVENSTNKLKFEEIFQRFVSQINSQDQINALDDKFVSIYVYINLVTATVDKITTGEEKEYLLKHYDNVYPFQKLSVSLNALENNLFNNGNYNYDFIYTGIFDFLSTVVKFADLIDKEFVHS